MSLCIKLHTCMKFWLYNIEYKDQTNLTISICKPASNFPQNSKLSNCLAYMLCLTKADDTFKLLYGSYSYDIQRGFNRLVKEAIGGEIVWNSSGCKTKIKYLEL